MQPVSSVKQQDLTVLPGVALNPGDAVPSLLLLTVLLPVGRPLALTPALPPVRPTCARHLAPAYLCGAPSLPILLRVLRARTANRFTCGFAHWPNL